jgi:hypothetical protein
MSNKKTTTAFFSFSMLRFYLAAKNRKRQTGSVIH